MASNTDFYDVIIIGSGAGGGTLAHQLAPTGKRILLLFGTDPRSSVLNTSCQAHEVGNLYMVDTSFFRTIGAVNPALTAIANAIRVGEHIRDRLA